TEQKTAARAKEAVEKIDCEDSFITSYLKKQAVSAAMTFTLKRRNSIPLSGRKKAASLQRRLTTPTSRKNWTRP
ncbi:MAG TPA: hypothetical protein PKI82_08970, partial [Ruminococcus flavefaciens]|nr:hypothetical protein [Ruminococcus flavefaciens]